MDDGQGAVTGSAGPEDRVGDQVVTTQGHRHTLVRENSPERRNKDTTTLYRQENLLVLLCNAVTGCLHVIETCNNIPYVSNLSLDDLTE